MQMILILAYGGESLKARDTRLTHGNPLTNTRHKFHHVRLLQRRVEKWKTEQRDDDANKPKHVEAHHDWRQEKDVGEEL